MKIIYQEKFWTREEVEKDQDHYYIFGDNDIEVGKGGQACIRGLPNAFGIPTKASPSEFWTDDLFERNCYLMTKAVLKIPRDKPWIISAAGLGTGLAELGVRAPQTFSSLNFMIKLVEEDNFKIIEMTNQVLRLQNGIVHDHAIRTFND